MSHIGLGFHRSMNREASVKSKWYALVPVSVKEVPFRRWFGNNEFVI